MDVSKMLARKDKIVSALTQGVQTLFKANKITSIHGRGRLLKDNRVEVKGKTGSQLFQLVGADRYTRGGRGPATYS